MSVISIRLTTDEEDIVKKLCEGKRLFGFTINKRYSYGKDRGWVWFGSL